MHLHHPAIAVLLAAVIAGGAHAASPTPAAMSALVNARIHTLDDSRPAAEAIAWDATGRIIAVGRRDEVLAQAPGATVHDANGATVVPGLVDAHAHLMGLGLALMRADLVGTRSKAEVVARLQAFAATLPPERVAAWARLGPERLARAGVPDRRGSRRGLSRSSGLARAHRRPRRLGELRCDAARDA